MREKEHVEVERLLTRGSLASASQMRGYQRPASDQLEVAHVDPHQYTALEAHKATVACIVYFPRYKDPLNRLPGPLLCHV